MSLVLAAGACWVSSALNISLEDIHALKPTVYDICIGESV